MKRLPEPRPPLLDEVLAAPDDEAPRLVYADWLQQQGDPRGTFIALQCAELKKPAGSHERLELQRRAAQLEQQHAAHWLGELPEWWEFRRGFLDAVVASEDFLRRVGPTLWAREPVRRIALDHRQTGCEQVPGLPFPRTLRALELKFRRVHPEDLLALFDATVMGQLHELRLEFASLGEPHLAALTSVGRFAKLEALSLVGNPLGNTGAATLARAPVLLSLTRLWLSECRVEVDGAITLFGSSNLGPLTELSLDGNPIGLEGLTALARSPASRTLQTLTLSGAGIGDEGVRLLASGAFPRLQQLDLENNGLTDAAAFRLLEPTLGRQLRSVRLGALAPPPVAEPSLLNSFEPALVLELRERYGPRLKFMHEPGALTVAPSRWKAPRAAAGSDSPRRPRRRS